MGQIEQLMALADRYAHVYSFVGDDTMPNARQALRTAIEQQAERIEELESEQAARSQDDGKLERAIESLQQQLADINKQALGQGYQPDLDAVKKQRLEDAEKWVTTNLAAPQPQPKQEPIGWAWQHDETGRTMCNLNDGINTPEDFKKVNPCWNLIGPLYTAPQQREWVGLTPSDVHELVDDADLDWHNGWSLDEEVGNRYLNLCRAIEAKLKEKNSN